MKCFIIAFGAAVSKLLPHFDLSPQVTVFEQEHFQGKCLEFTSECCNIQECGLDNIRSIRVESGA